MEATINEKAIRAIRTFLTRQDFEILDEGWAHGKDSIAFVAKEDDELVFIDTAVNENTGEGFPAEVRNRKGFERLAAAYLTAHPDMPSTTVRFDVITMMVLNESRAFMKHHRNSLGISEVHAS